jgi:hypothetical protein
MILLIYNQLLLGGPTIQLHILNSAGSICEKSASTIGERPGSSVSERRQLRIIVRQSGFVGVESQLLLFRRLSEILDTSRVLDF